MPFVAGTSGNPSTKFQKGKSGNPKGKPKGARHLRTIVRGLLDSSESYRFLPNTKLGLDGDLAPIEGIVLALTHSALAGNVQASRLLLEHYQDKTEVNSESNGFFAAQKLEIAIVENIDSSNDMQ